MSILFPSGVRFLSRAAVLTVSYHHNRGSTGSLSKARIEIEFRGVGRGPHGSVRTDNLDVRHPITAEVTLNVFDKHLLVPSQPLGIVA